MLSITNLSVEHGKLRALWNIDLTVAKGEKVALLGANGAGKSTTLGAIIGLYRPCGGDIRFEGESIAGRSPGDIIARGLSLVPEGRRLFPEMTVRENLEMGAYPPTHRAALNDALEHVFALFPVLKARAGSPAGSLSGGQQQMVAIGRALMSRPRLLLLDEPFIGVAPIVVEEVLTALRRIAEEGVTVLMVEQNVHRALDFAERASVIENGRTILNGNRRELLDDPEFGGKFLGLD